MPSFLIFPESHNSFKLLSILVDDNEGTSSSISLFVNFPSFELTAILTTSILAFLSDTNSTLSSKSLYALTIVLNKYLIKGVASSSFSSHPI